MPEQDRRILLAESHISVPEISMWERPFISVMFISLKFMANYIFPLTGNKELKQFAPELLEEAKTLIEAGDDFKKGRISGRYALPNERIRTSAFGVKLIQARLKAKKLKGNN